MSLEVVENRPFETRPHSLPSVNLHPDVESPGEAYRVSYDGEKFARFLKSNGLSDHEIASTEVVFCGKEPPGMRSPGSLALGYYNGSKISIYCENLIAVNYGMSALEAELLNGSGVIPSEVSLRKLYELVLTTKRLPSYLSGFPEPRRRQFAHKLFDKATTRFVNSTLIHEGKHVINRKTSGVSLIVGTKKEVAIYASTGLGTSMVTQDWDRPSSIAASVATATLAWLIAGRTIGRASEEKEVREFQKIQRHNPEWDGMLVIEPIGALKDVFEATRRGLLPYES